MNLPTLNSLNFEAKKVILRLDLDIKLNSRELEKIPRLQNSLPTISAIFSKAEKILLIGHAGRPEGKFVSELSLKPLISFFKMNMGGAKFIEFTPESQNLESAKNEFLSSKNKLYLLENLRFWIDEEKNSLEFAKQLADFGNVYVNDSFASSHRSHASTSTLPKLIKNKGGLCAIGIRFEEELVNLDKVITNPKRPVISIISGVKKDKLKYLEGIKKISDKVLIAGRLPKYFEQQPDDKLIVGKLIPDKEDLTVHSVELFENEISNAGTIIVSGPMGKFEDNGHRLATERILNSIAKNITAFKLAGGGDTQCALDMFGLSDKFNWISSGGGAMLTYLSTGTLPAIEALIN